MNELQLQSAPAHRPQDEAEIRYASVAIPVPLRKTFLYGVPASMAETLRPGARVAVMFGRRKLLGVILALHQDAPEEGYKIRPITAAVEEPVPFDAELLSFLQEAARYYFHPVGEVLRAASPVMSQTSLKKLREAGFHDGKGGFSARAASVKKRWILRLSDAGEAHLRACHEAEEGKDEGASKKVAGIRLGKVQRALCETLLLHGATSLEALSARFAGVPAKARRLVALGLVIQEEATAPSMAATQSRPTLTSEQDIAVDAIVSGLGHGQHEPAPAFLLEGVTGSGKTEVYMRVMEEALSRGMGALVLVPEISLTPQLVERFRLRFGEILAVLHSGVSNRERLEGWQALRGGTVRLAVGARSALFAPVQNLGVVIVDEEHDSSFKQETGFRYHARDMALLRARRAGAVALLGSATPSLESRYGVETKRLQRLVLSQRATSHSLPAAEVVDLNRHKEGPTKNALLSAPLFRAMEQCLERGEQTILFLNRRGFAPAARCEACGTVVECPTCSVSMTEHRGAGQLRCHYCEYWQPLHTPCRECGETRFHALGQGTEQIEGIIEASFPGVRVARLDRDTANAKSVEAILGRFRAGDVDVLVGTQMVTKGHDLPRVTLVGVLLADQSMSFPDFRASERTFQLLAQVAGRAGRGDRPGKVIVQTFQPSHPAVRYAVDHDYAGFFEHELHCRKELLYPPYSHLAALRVDAAEEAAARSVTEGLAAIGRDHPMSRGGQVSVLGPAVAPIARVRGRYRYRVLLRAQERKPLRAVVQLMLQRIDAGLGTVRASLDIDPVSML